MYAKIFRSLWEGTMIGQPDEQLVLVFLLAHAGPDGVVEVTQQYIAALTGLSIERVNAALETLCGPDEHSRRPDDEGRRLLPLDDRGWGWTIVNYSHYRTLRDLETVRQQNKERQARRRNAMSRSVTHGNGSSPQAEVEAEADEEAEEPPLPAQPPRARGKKPSTGRPEAFRPELIAELEAKYPTLDVRLTADKLLNHASDYRDWDQALRTWCRKAESEGWDRKTANAKDLEDAWIKGDT